MKCNAKKIFKSLIWFSITAYFALIPTAKAITNESGMGKYLLAVPLVFVIVFGLSNSRGKLSFSMNLYDWYYGFFSLYCFMTSLWATVPSYSINRAIDLFEGFLAMLIVQTFIPKEKTVEKLLKAVMIGYFFMVFYAIFKYGWFVVTNSISTESRLDNTFINANIIGLGAAFAIIICGYFLIYHQYYVGVLFSLPALIVLVASGSRKAIVVLVLGIIGLFVLKNMNNKHFYTTIFKVAITLAALILVVYFASKMQMFQGINERLYGLVNGLLGRGQVDNSTKMRMKLIDFGIELFRRNPIWGVGIDNPKYYAGIYLQRDYYLHNNYIEILSGGGIVGELIYYSIYILILIRLLKYRKYNDNKGEFDVVIVLLLLTLLTDYGSVSYDRKPTYFVLFIFYLEAEKLKQSMKQSIL